LDPLSIIGIILAFVAIIGGNWLDGGHLDALLNGPALLIVGGGTVGAILLHTPLPVFLRAMQMASMAVLPPQLPLQGMVKKIVGWSLSARTQGLLGLERHITGEPDLFIRKGLQLVVDGSDPEDIRRTLEVELDSREKMDMQAAKVYESMGGYAPTIGIIGAVMGLIHVMQNLADPSRLGSGIATAFVATIYGVGFANLFLIPLANKLKGHVRHQSHYRELVIEGLLSIAEGENPHNIEAKLKGFIH